MVLLYWGFNLNKKIKSVYPIDREYHKSNKISARSYNRRQIYVKSVGKKKVFSAHTYNGFFLVVVLYPPFFFIPAFHRLYIFTLWFALSARKETATEKK